VRVPARQRRAVTTIARLAVARIHSGRVMTAPGRVADRVESRVRPARGIRASAGRRWDDEPGGQVGVPDMGVTVDQATTDTLLALAMGESGVMGEAMEMREQLRADSCLDAKTYALVKIAALVALDAAPASYLFQVQGALDAGAAPREILGVLTTVAPQAGMARVVSAAPEIMIALGLELPAGMESEEATSNGGKRSR